MKKYLKLALMGIVVSFVTACAQTEYAIKGFVDGYCLNTPEKRALARLNVDAVTTPHKVRIQCAGDSTDETPE